MNRPPQWIRDQWSKDPQEEDILFPTAEQWKTLSKSEKWPRSANAGLHIQSHGGKTDAGYVWGYRRAAQLLAEAAVRSRYDTNVLVYPIVFLYRQAVELYMKRTIPLAAKLADQPLEKRDERSLCKEHKLDLLWTIFRPRLEELRASGQCDISDGAMAGISSYVRQLSDIDPGSFVFRYADSKPAHLRSITVPRIMQMMERLTNYFEGLDEMLHEQYQAKCAAHWETSQETEDGHER